MSSITKDDIAGLQDEIGKGLRAYKAFEKGEEILSKIANLTQYEGELTERINGLEQKQATEQAFLDDLVTRTNEANSKAERIVADAKLEAGRLVDEAKGDADLIVSNAHKSVEEKIAETNKLANVIVAQQAELEDLEKKVAETKQSLEAFRAKAQAI
jgi:cell division septum initiation protein DivIVA